jgi:spore maturation protein CgeB
MPIRVLISGNIFCDSFARNIALTVGHQGHTVRTVEESALRMDQNGFRSKAHLFLARVVPQVERRRHRALLRAVRHFQPKLILATHGSLPVEVVREMRASSDAKIALWFPDALVNLDRQYPLASDYDAWFFKDPYMVDTFRAKLGINAHYLPEACNPVWHQRVELNEREKEIYACDLTLACTMYYYRARLLEMFKDYDLRIWGNGYPQWMDSPLRPRYCGMYVGEVEKAKAFSGAKIVLNTMHYGEIAGVNCRLFEAAGCGAFQVADWRPGLAELFEPEREIVTFHTREELKEKVDYYLEHPKERRAIADRAHVVAHEKHTYEIRLRKLFAVLGLSWETTPVSETKACSAAVA